MSTLSPTTLPLLSSFSTLFLTSKTFSKAVLLLIGAILCKSGRTVCASLKVMGLQGEKAFQNYHRVLNRASWSALRGAKILLLEILASFQRGYLVVGVDEHLERRDGRKIRGIGSYRDAARSGHGYIVKSFGLKWISMMVLTPIPQTLRVFALPFLTVLAPSEKSNQVAKKKHKTSIDWTRQMMFQLRRWVRHLPIILVADGGFANAEMAWTAVRLRISLICRLRLDARLFDFPIRKWTGRPPKKGSRLPSPKELLINHPTNEWIEAYVKWYEGKTRKILYQTRKCIWNPDGSDPISIQVVIIRGSQNEYQDAALMSTDLNLKPEEIIERFVERWNLEVTFREAREHLGIETQRQWSDKAIHRTTPVLFGLYSLIVLIAQESKEIKIRSASWYCKKHVAFSDMLVEVRKRIWMERSFEGVSKTLEDSKIPIPKGLQELLEQLSEAI